MSTGKNARKKAEKKFLARELDLLCLANPAQYEIRLNELLFSWRREWLRRIRSTNPCSTVEFFANLEQRAGRAYVAKLKGFAEEAVENGILAEIRHRANLYDDRRVWDYLASLKTLVNPDEYEQLKMFATSTLESTARACRLMLIAATRH